MALEDNRSALSLNWLKAYIEYFDQNQVNEATATGGPSLGASVSGSWKKLTDDMRSRKLSKSMDSDPWLCKSQIVTDGRLVPIWSPPLAIDEFVHFPLPKRLEEHRQAQPTKYTALEALVQSQPILDAPAIQTLQHRALSNFTELYQRTSPPYFDEHQKQEVIILNQVMTWLDTAVGRYFKGLILDVVSPDQYEEAVGRAMARISGIAGSREDDPFEEHALISMQNMYREVDGTFTVQPVRAGQSELWRERWGFLSREVTASEAIVAIQLAAHLLANLPFSTGLLLMATQVNEKASAVAIGTLRRLLLSLRAMAWAERALRADWQLVRPKDILCFAFSALRPDWPNRSIALSHRSRNVKPKLVNTLFWSAPNTLIDATYAPIWESNIGMIWGLFAASPVILRMKSKAYKESEWCRRESELLDYLTDESDFLQDRHVVDLKESDTARLDELLADALFAGVQNFPRPVRLAVPPRLGKLEALILMAAGAVRFIGLAAGGNMLRTNLAIEALCKGTQPAIPCLTNNKRGWNDYRDIFQELCSHTQCGEGALPVQFGANYDAAAFQMAKENEAKNNPDFTDARVPPFRDHLAASEWARISYASLAGTYKELNIAVDCRDLTLDQWEADGSLAIYRGLTSAATTAPAWFIQHADARVDKWPLIGDFRPIFTEQVEGQFSWMNKIPPPKNWMSTYLQQSKLVFSPQIHRLIAGLPGKEDSTP